MGNLLRTHTNNEWERDLPGRHSRHPAGAITTSFWQPAFANATAPAIVTIFPLALFQVAPESGLMKNYTKILFSILAAAICSTGFAAEPQSCKKTSKNCPMNDNKKCNCGKNCSC
jgi:hypothetical protein